MENDKIKLKLAKSLGKVLTFLLSYAKMILEVYWYSSIVVYFDGQKSLSKNDKLGHQDKKQKQKQLKLANLSLDRAGLRIFGLSTEASLTPDSTSEILAKVDQKNQYFNRPEQSVAALSGVGDIEQLNTLFVITFCFLSKRFFSAFCHQFKGRKTKNKNKNKDRVLFCPNQNYDSWTLPATRHLARNRSQQNHTDPLGRKGINSQSPQRQPGVALLYQKSGQRNYQIGSRNQLLSRKTRRIFRTGTGKLKRNCLATFSSLECKDCSAGLILLSFLFNQIRKYVLAETKIKSLYSLGKKSSGAFGYQACRSRRQSKFEYLINNHSQNDRWLLPIKRYLARDRSQQNHADSLGRRGSNPQSPTRQSGVALLYQKSGQRNYQIGSRNQLLSGSRKSPKIPGNRNNQLIIDWFNLAPSPTASQSGNFTNPAKITI